MQVLTDGIGDVVLNELKKASHVRLAVAFFSPDDRMLAALSAVQRLTVVVSEEFTVNNPYTLEKLPERAIVRSIPPESESGKLHAKVLLTKRKDGSHWALLGSANMTRFGMFKNQEACVTLESADDETAITDLDDWFKTLLPIAREIDFEGAKKIFDSRSMYRMELRPKSGKSGVGYWALKTTSGKLGKSHWPQFLEENVLAIGWSGIPVDPSKVSDEKLAKALHDTYPDDSVGFSVKKIREFVSMKNDDLVVICRGYSTPNNHPVFIHGLARVTGPFRADPMVEGKWRFKHPAVIQPLEIELPKDLVSKAFGMGSLMHTIHQLDAAAFDRFRKVLLREGVHVEV